MGTLQAGRIINLIGTSKQQDRFKEIKQDTANQANQAYSRAEQHFVDNLKRELEIGELSKTLLRWRGPYLHHKELDNKPQRDSRSNMTYANEIEPAKSTATQFHKFHKKNPNLPSNPALLSEYVDKVITDTLDASMFNINRTAKAKAGLLESLGWERADTFVSVYGNDDQKAEWRAMFLPQIKENLGLAPIQPSVNKGTATTFSPTKRI